MKKYKSIMQAVCCFMVAVSFSACYDLAEMNINPNAQEDVSSSNDPVIDLPVDPDYIYKNIDIDFAVTKRDSLALESGEASIGTTFRNFFYEGFYNDYQLTTNLTHDIYAGYLANNVNDFKDKSPDYLYNDGWSAARWRHFYNDRSSEYRRLMRTFHFVDKEYYRNAFYITRIYYAFLALANTDTYGDMPFSVYARGRMPEEGNVPYDSQKEVYEMLFHMLKQAVDSIRPNDGEQFNFGQDDRCYKGDASKWQRFANTLRLRMALRISNVDPAWAKEEAEAALTDPNGLLESNKDNMVTIPKHASVADGGDGIGGNENPLPMISIAYRAQTVLSKDLELFYKNLSTGGGKYKVGSEEKYIDPRCLVSWYRPGKFNDLTSGNEDLTKDFTGLERGSETFDNASEKGYYSLTRTLTSNTQALNSKYWFSYSRPSVWLGYAESLFLKAEAALRGWNGTELSAEEYFKAGIRASMDYYEINSTDVDSYINGLAIYKAGAGNPFQTNDKEAALEQIITQKWMAVFPNSNEAWADFRRTDYPALKNQLRNASAGDVPQGKLIKRVRYPDSELTNTQFGGNIKQGERLWWDVADTNDDSGKRQQPNNFR